MGEIAQCQIAQMLLVDGKLLPQRLEVASHRVDPFWGWAGVDGHGLVCRAILRMQGHSSIASRCPECNNMAGHAHCTYPSNFQLKWVTTSSREL